MAKPTSHPVVTRRVRTMVLILSVTEAKVCPGSSTGVGGGLGAYFDSRRSSATRLSFEPRARVPELGQVSGARAGIQLGQQPVITRLGLELRHAALRVIDVAEDDGPGGADGLAGGVPPPGPHPISEKHT